MTKDIRAVAIIIFQCKITIFTPKNITKRKQKKIRPHVAVKVC